MARVPGRKGGPKGKRGELGGGGNTQYETHPAWVPAEGKCDRTRARSRAQDSAGADGGGPEWRRWTESGRGEASRRGDISFRSAAGVCGSPVAWRSDQNRARSRARDSAGADGAGP